jgi:hypothetical protein
MSQEAATQEANYGSTLDNNPVASATGEASTSSTASSPSVCSKAYWAGLSHFNYLNLTFYIINVAITYASLTGIFGPTNTALSAKYQTLVTPAGWAFSIWGPIFIWEGVFAVAQMLPAFRSHPIITDGISYFWAALCVFQVAWSIAFAQEVIWLALVFMLMILASLVIILYRNYSIATTTFSEYYLIKAVFQLQCGWIVAASAVNTNVMFASALLVKDFVIDNSTVTDVVTAAGPDVASTLLGVAIVSLAAVFICGLKAASLEQPQIIVVGVVAWALGAVASELRYGKSELQLVKAMFDTTVLHGVSTAAATLSVLAAVMVGVLCAVEVYRQFVSNDAPRSSKSRTATFSESLLVGSEAQLASSARPQV